jgi:hypothetical protein
MSKLSFAKWQTQAAAPSLDADEALIFRAYSGTGMFMLIGIVLLFIPPFIWGAAVIAYAVYRSKCSSYLLTDRRLLCIERKINDYWFLGIPLEQVTDVQTKSDATDLPSIVDWLRGTAEVFVAAIKAQSAKVKAVSAPAAAT